MKKSSEPLGRKREATKVVVEKEFLQPDNYAKDEGLQVSKQSIALEGYLNDPGLKLPAFSIISAMMGVALLLSFAAIFFAGFEAWGFDLPESTLNFLVGSIIGEIIVIGGIVYREVFSQG